MGPVFPHPPYFRNKQSFSLEKTAIKIGYRDLSTLNGSIQYLTNELKLIKKEDPCKID